MTHDLIRRLKIRIQNEPTVDMEVCPPICPRPPASKEDLTRAEAKLGFPLPPLVFALYEQVADGGFGPGYGFIQLDRVVASRFMMNEETELEWKWPDQLVELVNWGCHYFSGIDGSDPSCRVYFYNNDRAGEGATLADCLLPESESLEEWLSAWLDGANLWERGTKRGIHQ